MGPLGEVRGHVLKRVQNVATLTQQGQQGTHGLGLEAADQGTEHALAKEYFAQLEHSP